MSENIKSDPPGKTLSVFKHRGNLMAEVAKNGLVVVDFFGTFCNPCKVLKPKLEKLCIAHPDVNIGVFNIEDDFEFVVAEGIQHVPAILFYKDGKKVDAILKNVTVDAIEAKIKELK